jgi:ElaB/YqjD/DUF883 family membrane-anchored ribosome-binding protein
MRKKVTYDPIKKITVIAAVGYIVGFLLQKITGKK